MVDLTRVWDVMVVGGGNAALCAAITARKAGASVIVCEHAPKAMRGGNSRHTRTVRALHAAPTGVLTEKYLEEEYWDDLLKVTGGRTDEALARMTIRASEQAPKFLESCGVVFQPSLSGTLSLSRTNAFFLGGGKALLNALYRTAEKLGVELLYDTEVQHIAFDDGFAREAVVSHRGFPERIRAKAVIASSGGFQANRAWLREYWGDAADRFQIRGTPYAQGRVLKDLLAQGAQAVGDPTQFHAVANDAPRYAGYLAGGTWGIMNEVGNWPGAWWLFPYTSWYQWGYGATGASGDLYVIIMTVLFALPFIFLPWIPGLRDIPKATRLYRVMWKPHYDEQRRNS